MKQVQTVDEALDQLQLEQEVAIEQALEGTEKPAKKSKVPEKKKTGRTKLLSASDALSKSARLKLENYLKQSPQYRIIDEQINLLMIELKNYRKIGDEQLIASTEEMVKGLAGQRNKFIKIYKQKNYQKEKEILNEKVKNSTLLKELKDKRKSLEIEYRMSNANSLYGSFLKYKEILNIKGENSQPASVDFDDYLDNEYQQETQKLGDVNELYSKILGRIADILDMLPSEIETMPTNKLQQLLKEFCPDTTELKDEIESVKLQASNEMNRLGGKEDITDVIFNIFDMEIEPEEKPKEMLAAANVEYVKAIAYNTCSRLNMLHNLDDAIAYGLVGLTVSINKWYGLQKLANSALSFTGFAYSYVSNAIKRGMYELTSGGTISKSVAATIEHKRNLQIKNFKQSNPELNDMPAEMLESLMDTSDIIEKPKTPIAEADYVAAVGVDGDGGDIWSNANPDNESSADENFKHEDVLNSIKSLFGMFETKTDKKTGIQKITNNKMFNKYDYKLFKLLFGIETKSGFDDNGNPIKANYTQEEIASELQKYYAENGITKTFEQSAINYRKEVLLKKIGEAVKTYPVIKAGFEYLYYNMAETISYLSTNKEEDVIKDTQQEFEQQLSSQSISIDGSASYQGIDLDSQIAQVFSTL